MAKVCAANGLLIDVHPLHFFQSLFAAHPVGSCPSYTLYSTEAQNKPTEGHLQTI